MISQSKIHVYKEIKHSSFTRFQKPKRTSHYLGSISNNYQSDYPEYKKCTEKGQGSAHPGYWHRFACTATQEGYVNDEWSSCIYTPKGDTTFVLCLEVSYSQNDKWTHGFWIRRWSKADVRLGGWEACLSDVVDIPVEWTSRHIHTYDAGNSKLSCRMSLCGTVKYAFDWRETAQTCVRCKACPNELNEQTHSHLWCGQ